MANRRSNAIDRIVELAKAPNRGALDQHSDETLFHLADLHAGTVRPSPAPRRRWLPRIVSAAIVLVVVTSIGWIYTAQRAIAIADQARADRLAAEAEVAALEAQAEAEQKRAEAEIKRAVRRHARAVRHAEAGSWFAKAAEVLSTRELQDPDAWAKLFGDYKRLLEEQERSDEDGPEDNP